VVVVVVGKVMSSESTEKGGANKAADDNIGNNGGEIKEEMKNELRRGKNKGRKGNTDLYP